MEEKISIEKAKDLIDKFIYMRSEKHYNFYNELAKMDKKGKGIDEPCHSKILALLLKKSHHFRVNFLQYIDINNFYSWADDIEVEPEKNIDVGSIDIFIYTKKTNDFLCVIENKIDSSFSDGQLKKYKDYIEVNYKDYEQRIYTCTKRYWDKAPQKDKNQAKENNYIQIEHSDIPLMVDNNVLLEFEHINPKMRYDIEQYKEFLNCYWYDTVDDIHIEVAIKTINDNDLLKYYKEKLSKILDNDDYFKDKQIKD